MDGRQWLNCNFEKLHSNEPFNLEALSRGKVLVLVNTASYCGFTRQLGKLETLYTDYQSQGLEIVGFPSYSFNQENKDQAKTADVCFKNFGVTFTMAQTSSVKGEDVNPIYRHINEVKGKPRWNFYKYIVDKEGNIVAKYSSLTNPTGGRFIRCIERLLAN